MKTSPLPACLAILAAAVVCGPARTQGQSLADLADRTAQQRKDAPPSKSYRDADLKPTRDETDGSATARPADPSSVPPGAMVMAADGPREDVVRAVMLAVATIESGTSTGTGFFVSSDILVTNKHVIASARTVRLRFSDGTTSAGSVHTVAGDADLALVRADQPPASHPVLRLNPASRVRVGEEVLAVGSALGLLQGTVTRGIVSAVRSAGGLTVIQTDAAINPGNSGGPLIDRTGAVVGVTTAKMTGAESLGFAIATDHVSELIAGNSSVLRHDAAARDSSSDGSLDAALGGTGRSDSDDIRERGLQQFERSVESLARAADMLDGEWRRYRNSCSAVRGADASHEWLGIWLGNQADAESSSPCRALWDYIVSHGTAIDAQMRQADEDARQAGVFPGTARAVRQKHGMTWDGWDR